MAKKRGVSCGKRHRDRTAAWTLGLAAMLAWAVATRAYAKTATLFLDIPTAEMSPLSAARLTALVPEDAVRRVRQATPSSAATQAGQLGRGDALVLNLFPDAEFSATIDRLESNVNGSYTIRARLEGYRYGYALISTTDRRTAGSVVIPELNRRYLITTDPETMDVVLIDIDVTKHLPLESAPPRIPAAPEPSADGELLFETVSAETPIASDVGDAVSIEVMIVYTPAALAWADENFGGIDNVIAQAMGKGQLTMDNSDTSITLNLVHAAEVNYTESGDGGKDLERLTGTTDGYMDEVHDWRDAYGADLVALFTDTNSYGGIGWLLNTKNGLPDYGFSIARVQQVGWTYTLVHELGHNMGAHHHKEQNVQPGPTVFNDWSENTWSAGWRWVDDSDSRYCSVMTYESGEYFDDGLNHTRVAYFSNPSILHDGQPVGDAANGDNARTLNETKFVVANYRASVSEPEPYLTLNPTAREHSADVSHENTIQVSANVSWTATEDVAWLTITDGAGGDGNGTITYSVQANTLASERIGTLTVSGGSLTRVFTVTQAKEEVVPPPETLGEAVDAPWLPWTTGGDADWFYQTEITLDGVDAAQSGNIGNNNISWVQTTVTGPAIVRFSWRIDSRDKDSLAFDIDSSNVTNISGKQEWETFEIELHAGERSLRWTYATSSGGNAEATAAWLDQVKVFTTNGIPMEWLLRYALPTDGSVDFTDIDDDGMTVYQEWIAGTDPTNEFCVLRMEAGSYKRASDEYIIRWRSVDDRLYTLLRATNLLENPSFRSLATDIPGQEGFTEFTDDTPAPNNARFYRVRVEHEP